MTSKLTDKAAQLIERVTELMRERLPEPSVDMAQAFVRHYYAWVATEDLLERAPEDLYGAALSHWNLSRQRRPGIPIIRVYNPSFEEHGWQCTHTVVEIVTDDMPFLVDSMTMELNRHGLTVHQVIHPVLRVTRATPTVICNAFFPAEPMKASAKPPCTRGGPDHRSQVDGRSARGAAARAGRRARRRRRLADHARTADGHRRRSGNRQAAPARLGSR